MEWNEYKKNVKDALDSFEFDRRIPEILKEAGREGKIIFVAGNGGSAALCSHYSCDLSKWAARDWKENRKRLRVVNLACDVGYMTAISNDEDYSEVFRQQLINLARPHDVLVLISSSGNSPNIIKAAEYGKEIGMKVVGVCGFDGGRLKGIADYNAHVKVKNYQLSEDVHHIFGHFLAVWLRESEG